MNLLKAFDKTMWKFALVGVINTVVGTTVMFVSYNCFGLGYWISSALNYIIGSIVSYFLNKYYTFQDNTKSIKTLIKFVGNIAICYICAYNIAKPLVSFILYEQSVTFQENVAMLVGMFVFVALNYCGQRFFVFNHSSSIDEKFAQQ